jgi:hypothetical protein
MQTKDSAPKTAPEDEKVTTETLMAAVQSAVPMPDKEARKIVEDITHSFFAGLPSNRPN